MYLPIVPLRPLSVFLNVFNNKLISVVSRSCAMSLNYAGIYVTIKQLFIMIV